MEERASFLAKKGFFKTLRSFSFAAALFAGTLGVALFGAVFASCENLNGDMSSPAYAPSSGGANGGQGAGGQGVADAAGASVENCLTANVSLPNLPTLSGNAPIPKNVAQNISKSAFPNIADATDPSYSFSATLAQTGAGGATYSADGTYDSVTGTCSFAFAGAQSASAASYTLTVSLWHTGGTPATKSLVASASQSVTVGAGDASFAASVQLAPNLDSAPNGSLSLPIKFSDTSVSSVKLMLLNSAETDVTTTYLDGLTGTTLNLTSGEGTIASKDGGLPAGTYTLFMSFMKGTAMVGSRTESLNIYPTMQTKLWWTKDGLGTAATSLSVTNFAQKEFYVRGTGGVFYTTVFPTAAEAEDTNNGSFAFPLKTIQEAVDRIQAAGDTTSLFTVYIDGKIECDPDADYSANEDSLVKVGSSSALCTNNILFKGWTGPDTDIIDLKKDSASTNKGRAFYVKASSSAKVTVKDLGIAHGAASSNGGAFYIISCSDASFENCKISECSAENNGGGIYISKSNLELKKCVVTQSEGQNGGGVYVKGDDYSTAKGCLTIEKSEISANSAASGGGVYVSVFSTLNFLSGQIGANTATYSSTVPNSGLGGGIYINSGKCFISGSAVVGQALALTSSAATSADGSHSNKARLGAGIFNRGGLYLGYTDDSTPAAWTGAICYNYASSEGGGVYSDGLSVVSKMHSGSVVYNLCGDGSEETGGGGGVAVKTGDFTMDGGSVSYNQTNNRVGGGIYIDGGGTLALSGTAEVSSNKAGPEGIGTKGGAGLFAYRASITMEGNAVVKDNVCKAVGGGVYLYEYENAASCASLAMSGNAKILENTSSDGFGGAVYVTQRCSFSMSGAATIPAGVAGTAGAGKNDVYLDENTSVAVPAAITSTATPVASITPKSPYAVGTVVLTGTALSATECSKFAVTQPSGVEFPWTIEYDSTNGGVLKHDRNVFYVADYGDNTSGDGTKDNPYETIKFALTKFTDKKPASVDFKNKIYVLTNMTYDAGLGSDVPCYYEIVGCNGKTVGSNVTFTFNTPDDSGLYVAYGQKIKLTHIDITQSSATVNNYAAILVENSSTNGVGELWMEDSSIKNMYAKSCSAIAAKGDVHLKNVEISGNKTVANTSGATPFGPAINSTSGTVSVLGKVVIKDNQMQINTAAAGDPPSYVYKDQNLWIGENTGTAVFHPIRIAGILDSESDIGVTLFDYGTLYTTFTSGFASAGISAPSDVFTSDDGMSVVKSSNEATMSPPTTLYVRLGGSDHIGNGSSLLPFATIQKALDKINGLNNASADYTIKVEGVLAAAQHALADDALKAATLTIKGDSAATSVVSGGLSVSSEPILWLSEVTVPVTIENIGFISGKNSGSPSGGGAILAESCANITIKDSAFTSCSATSANGGAIYFDGGTLTLSNTSFTGNSSGYNGGAIFVKTGTLEMNSGTIAANTATGSGGGVSVGSGGTFIMSGGKISGNSAGLYGGGINNSGIVCIYGDAVIGDSSASGTATSDTDCSNKADYNGGGICNQGKLALGYKTWTSSATAPSNPQTLDGGVYYNYAQVGGGIFNANSSTLYIASGNISKNMAASTSGNDGGGGIDSYGASAKLYMTGGTVSQNNSAHFGGGVLVYSGAVELTGVTISGNTASSNGGGFACVGGTVTMNSGTIGGLGAGNIGAGGAGVYLKQDVAAGTPVFTMKGGEVSYNTVASGGSGGGFMNQYGTLNIQGAAEISNNDGGSNGGGILTFGTTNMTGGTISANTAHNGGGVFVFQNDFAMSDGTISGNTATVNPSAADPSETGHGGGVYVNNLADGATTYLGDFKLSGAAYIPLGTGNDVYLQNSITIEGDLTHAAPAATITPSVYSSGTIVLTEASAGLVAGNYGKFAVTPQTVGAVTKNWTVNSLGYLAELTTGGGTIVIHTPEGDLNLAASATTIATSASSTTVTISATDASGSAITSGLTWNGVTVYYGAEEIDSKADNTNSYTFAKTFPKGTYRLNVSVTYKGTTYSDSFTIKKTVDGAANEGPLATPLTLEAIVAGATVTFKNKASGTVTFKQDGGTSQTIPVGETVSIILASVGSKVEFFGDNTAYGVSGGSDNCSKISCSADCYVYGNVMSLVNSANFESADTLTGDYAFMYLFDGNSKIKNKTGVALLLPATTLTKCCYTGIFKGCENLAATPALPATTMAENCYSSMFSGCASLTAAPVLPATTMAEYCYSSMFKDCTSLTAAPALPATTLAERCYNQMFQGCTSLTAAPELPATTMAEYCYCGMFQDCTNLTAAPLLPATTLAEDCYGFMFQGCTSLTTAPALPATTLADWCYAHMFSGCTSLTAAPALSATTLADWCCINMFQDCTSLTAAPALLATTLATGCYEEMFSGCTSLTAAPALYARTLVQNCYQSMFKNCSSLNSVTCLAQNITALNCTTDWLSGVSATGTFTKLKFTDWSIKTNGANGIPSGWTVKEET